MKKSNCYVDLTHEIEEGMLTFGAHWHPKISIKQLGEIDVEGRETKELKLGTHTGTHIDAPLHFFKNGKNISDIPFEILHGDVSIVDCTFLKKDQCITYDFIKNINITERMIFKFGWGKYWGNKEFYNNYPYFSEDAANYLVANGVKLIGMDTPSPDDSRTKFGSEKDSIIHKIFLGNNVTMAEYLANLDLVTEYDGWKIIAMPLRIKNGDGSPARICLYR